MAQATHATTPRRRAVQSAKCEKSPAEAKPSFNGTNSLSIADLAQELADLQRLCIMMANAEGPAERARDQVSDSDEEEHGRRCMVVLDIEEVGRRAHNMVGGLEKLILTLEPTTPSEVLSLALILAEEIEVFNGLNISRTECRIDRERLGLEDALQAIVRGLIRTGATSPLIDAYSTKSTLRPWAEARSTATREAVPYLVEYDPVQGCLKTRGARS